MVETHSEPCISCKIKQENGEGFWLHLMWALDQSVVQTQFGNSRVLEQSKGCSFVCLEKKNLHKNLLSPTIELVNYISFKEDMLESSI
jgi:hypothetical protein